MVGSDKENIWFFCYRKLSGVTCILSEKIGLSGKGPLIVYLNYRANALVQQYWYARNSLLV